MTIEELQNILEEKLIDKTAVQNIYVSDYKSIGFCVCFEYSKNNFIPFFINNLDVIEVKKALYQELKFFDDAEKESKNFTSTEENNSANDLKTLLKDIKKQKRILEKIYKELA